MEMVYFGIRSKPVDITATFVVLNWDVGWDDGEGEVHVGVLWTFPKALALPHPGNLDCTPV
jgi:hypothetical protein